MKLDQNSWMRLYNKGNQYYDYGCEYTWLPGIVPEYTGWKDEQLSWKNTCYIGDWTLCLNELIVEGPDALKFLSDITTNSFASFEIGRAKHYVQCTENGKVAAEGILFRLAEDKFMLQSNVGWTDYQYQIKKDMYDISVYMPESKLYHNAPIEGDYFKFQISGPKALQLCEKVTGQSLRDVKFMHFVNVKINGHELMALRQGMAGEIGFEIQGPLEIADEIYQAVFKAGEEYGCRRLGERNGMINHLEACFPTWAVHYLSSAIFDNDYLEYMEKNNLYIYYPCVSGSFDGDAEMLTYSPYEMGWAPCVVFDHDFVGRKALEEEVRNIRKNVVTLEFDEKDLIEIYASQFRTDEEPYKLFEMPMTQNCVVDSSKVLDKNGNLIGIAATPGYSYYFRKMLALTFLDKEFCEPGTEVTVVWGDPGQRQKLIRATVAPAPYKTDRRRTDLKTV